MSSLRDGSFSLPGNPPLPSQDVFLPVIEMVTLETRPRRKAQPVWRHVHPPAVRPSPLALLLVPPRTSLIAPAPAWSATNLSEWAAGRPQSRALGRRFQQPGRAAAHPWAQASPSVDTPSRTPAECREAPAADGEGAGSQAPASLHIRSGETPSQPGALLVICEVTSQARQQCSLGPLKTRHPCVSWLFGWTV